MFSGTGPKLHVHFFSQGDEGEPGEKGSVSMLWEVMLFFVTEININWKK